MAHRGEINEIEAALNKVFAFLDRVRKAFPQVTNYSKLQEDFEALVSDHRHALEQFKVARVEIAREAHLEIERIETALRKW